MSSKTQVEQEDWEIVEKAGKLAGLTNDTDEEESEY